MSCNSLVSAKRKRRRRFNKPQHAADPFQTYSGTVMESVKIDTENGINKEGQQPDQNEKVVTVSKGINEIGHPTDINGKL